MIAWLNLSRRGWMLLGVVLLFALAAALPLRAGFSLLGLAGEGAAARSLRGSVWLGEAEDLRIGKFRIGTVRVMLSPVGLLIGRARIDIGRQQGSPDDIKGALTIGLVARGIDDVTGHVALDAIFGPLPLSAVEMKDVSIAFSGNRCIRAEGRMQAVVTGGPPGLDLANGLSGEVRCEGDVLLIPLVSQSGTQRLDIRVDGEGRYHAVMTVAAADPTLITALGTSGFRANGGDQLLRIDGSL